MYGSLYNAKSKIIVRTTVRQGFSSSVQTHTLTATRRPKIGCSSRPRTGWLASSGWNGPSSLELSHAFPSDIISRPNNATIEVIIEKQGFNNSLAGSLNCPNADSKGPGNEARAKWIHTYLQDGEPRCKLF